MTAAERQAADRGRAEEASPSPFQSSGEKGLTPADFSGIDELVEACWIAVKDGLRQLGYGPGEAKIHLALHEALINAWKHGNGRRPELPIIFRWRFAEDFTVEIQDAGVGFACRDQTDPFTPDRLTAENGRGLFIIRFCADSVRWDKNGSRIIITFSHP